MSKDYKNYTESQLRQMRREYENELDNANDKVAALQEAYDSLIIFKGIVQGSQEDFVELNSGKSALLSLLESSMVNNPAIKEYHTKMKRSLTEVGTNFVGKACPALIGKIDTQLSKYKTDIDTYDDRVKEHQVTIAEIKEAIIQKRAEGASGGK